MKFTIGDIAYDTSGMDAFETGDPAEPRIFMDRNCQVFVLRKRGDSEGVDHVLTPEISRLMDRYNVKALGRALRGHRLSSV